MAKWEQTLDICDEWDLASSGAPPKDFAAAVLRKLSALKPYDGHPHIENVRQHLIEQLKAVTEDVWLDYNDAECFLHELYNFGDMKIADNHIACWIKVME